MAPLFFGLDSSDSHILAKITVLGTAELESRAKLSQVVRQHSFESLFHGSSPSNRLCTAHGQSWLTIPVAKMFRTMEACVTTSLTILGGADVSVSVTTPKIRSNPSPSYKRSPIGMKDRQTVSQDHIREENVEDTQKIAKTMTDAFYLRFR